MFFCVHLTKQHFHFVLFALFFLDTMPATSPYLLTSPLVTSRPSLFDKGGNTGKIDDFKKELNEKCGVLGLATANTQALGHCLFFGLYALQHRGQESCGMAVFNNDHLNLHKGMGLVSQVFNNEDTVAGLTGQIGVGHTRYATTGGSCHENSQPVVCRSRLGSLVLAHNGNLFNLSELRDRFHLEASDAYGMDSDSHVMARCIAQQLVPSQGDLLEACKTVFEQCQGAFSVVVASGDALVAARDRHGIRPLSLGELILEDGAKTVVVASETSAFDILGATFIRDLEPGEVFVAYRNGQTAQAFLEGSKANRFCVFEYVYFARPDSTLLGQSVYYSRVKMGQLLAKKHPVQADMVIPVPDSGNPAAVGFSQQSGIPYMEGLIKNRYVGRTFINPTQALRVQGLRLKLNPLAALLKDKKVVVVDDSIVRGNTSHRLVEMLKECGVKEIHFRVSSAPVKHPCFYGIDMSTEEELLANRMNLAEIQDWLGVTSLEYLSLEEMAEATGKPMSGLCVACFNADYPAGRPDALIEQEPLFKGAPA
jgi:amidophosphoribosyltransferase